MMKGVYFAGIAQEDHMGTLQGNRSITLSYQNWAVHVLKKRAFLDMQTLKGKNTMENSIVNLEIIMYW